ncbi:M20 family metallopeptidase [Cytobacillus sp. FSL W7-1323]|uniref:M20 metallopeptidase family protein n=1 Tax=unclassified Cytobacillus TaxID=2675268 RepID=UPI002AFF33EB|nr:M20 family metallopeptidase [Cytobacillus sp. OWB-43]MEA1852583.1 M20 family metallopeptidase [Cytobacillus sp. OWB-43]
MTVSFKGEAKEIATELTLFRRELHEYPELSGEEVQTSSKIQQKLNDYQIPYQTGFAKTGILAIIKGAKQGPTVCLRADIDALPIEEQSGVSYSSKVKGVMHACGHDSHAAMLLGAGIILNKHKGNISGTILLLFQPAEEKSPIGGAKIMMEDGVFDEYKPSVIIGQHVWPDLPPGQIGVRPGPMMGNSDRFSLKITGSGGHASMPHTTIDAIIIANQVITMLQTIVSRNIDPLESAVVTVGKVSGGAAHNVIAEEVIIEGTVRTLTDKVKTQVKNRFHQIVTDTVKALGGRVEITYLDGYPSTVNTPEWAERVKETAAKFVGKENVPEVAPSMAGEDFGRFLKEYPGVYYWLGCSIGNNQKPLHNPSFQLDENILPIGMELMAQVAIDTIEQLQSKGL